MTSLKSYVLRSARNLLYLLPLTQRRLVFSYLYNKDWFLLKSSKNVFTEIYKTNLWESEESHSGGGSTLKATAVIRNRLPAIIEDYNIESMLDIPCGDYNWMKTVDRSCSYIGSDIVEELIERNNQMYSSDDTKFMHLDLTRDDLPQVDLIFCRDCLQHLSYEDVKKALNNIKKSRAKYLLVTSYHKTRRNHDIYTGDYRPLNLQISPFNFPAYMEKLEEMPKEVNTEIDKTMYLFRIEDLPGY